MAEGTIFARIDARLIHVQVATSWQSVVNATEILVVSDEVSSDKMRQGLMDMAAPEGVATRYLPVTVAAEELKVLEPAARVFVLVESPQDAVRLIEAGAPITKFNIGNLPTKKDTRQVTQTVAVTDDDVAAFEALRDKGIELELQRVPTVPVDDISALFA